MKATILVLVGLPGSGKTTAAGFFKKHALPVIRMGEVTENLLKKEGKKISEKNEYGVRDDLRKKYGMDIYARLTLPLVCDAVQKNDIVVIEGMMSQSEKKYFETRFSKIKIIYIESLKETRFKRLGKRHLRPLNTDEAEKREDYEINKLGKLELKEEADTVILNDTTLEEFYGKLEEILKM